MVGCSAASSRSRIAVVSRPQRRRHGGAVLRRHRHPRAAGHVAQGRPGNDDVGASACDADARRDPRRGSDGRRSVHVHVPQRGRTRLTHHQTCYRGSVTTSLVDLI